MTKILLFLLAFLVANTNGLKRIQLQAKTQFDDLSNLNSNHLYYGAISIGTPAQKFELLFDTSSTDFWVPSSECTDNACQLHKSKYYSSRSSSYVAVGKNYSLNSIDYALSGYLSKDLVRFTGIDVRNQFFGEMVKGFGDEFRKDLLDGVVGMSFDGKGADGSDTLLANMYNQGLLPNKVFSFWMQKTSVEHQNGVGKGELFLGGSDSDYFTSQMVHVPLIEQSTRPWEFKVDSLRLGLNYVTRICTNGCQASINTGTMDIWGPKEDIYDILNALDAMPNSDGSYQYKCGFLHLMPDVIFKIQGKDYTFAPEDYSWKKPGFNPVFPDCIANFKVLEDQPETNDRWVFGTTFIRKYYTEFDADRQRIGFADSGGPQQ